MTGPVLQLANGTLLLFIYGNFQGDSGASQFSNAVIFSNDGGSSWGTNSAILIARDATHTLSFDETMGYQDENGIIHVLIRQENGAGGYYAATSPDNGITWSPATLSLISPAASGRVRPAIAYLGNNRVFYVGRAGTTSNAPLVNFCYSPDNMASWTVYPNWTFVGEPAGTNYAGYCGVAKLLPDGVSAAIPIANTSTGTTMIMYQDFS